MTLERPDASERLNQAIEPVVAECIDKFKAELLRALAEKSLSLRLEMATDAIKAIDELRSKFRLSIEEKAKDILDQESLLAKLCLPLSVLKLSVRPTFGLSHSPNPIDYIGDLVQKTRQDLIDMKYFGRKCLKELEGKLLAELGLTVETKLDQKIKQRFEEWSIAQKSGPCAP